MVERSEIVVPGGNVSVHRFSGKNILKHEGLNIEEGQQGVAVVFPAYKRLYSRRTVMIEHSKRLIMRAINNMNPTIIRDKFLVDIHVGETEYTILGVVDQNNVAAISDSIKTALLQNAAVAA